MAFAPLTEEAPTEHDMVVAWRLSELLRVEYPVGVAERLAGATHVDLHRAVELARQGCSPELAAKILL